MVVKPCVRTVCDVQLQPITVDGVQYNRSYASAKGCIGQSQSTVGRVTCVCVSVHVYDDVCICVWGEGGGGRGENIAK